MADSKGCLCKSLGYQTRKLFHQKHLQEGKDSTRQSLRICAEVANHMDQLRTDTQEGTGQAFTFVFGNPLSPKRLTGSTIQECRETFVNTTSELENHLHKINSRLESFARLTKQRTEEQK